MGMCILAKISNISLRSRFHLLLFGVDVLNLPFFDYENLSVYLEWLILLR